MDGTDVACYGRNGVLTKKDVFRWTLHSSLILNGKTGVRSDYFTFAPASGSKFCLLLQSDPEKADIYNNQFGVCLYRVPTVSASDVAIKVSFSLLDIRDRLHHSCERTMKDQDRVYATFDRSIFDKHQLIFLRKGAVIIHCALDVEELITEDCPSMPIVFPVPDTAKDLVDDLMTLLDNEKFSDVVLGVDGQDFRVHRAILGARSPVFAAMFEHETLEKTSSRVVIEDIPSDVIPQLLRYLYTGEADKLVPQTALSLFVAADKYSLPKLKQRCSRYLCENLTTDMALSILTIADMHQDDDLKDAAIRVILDNAIRVMKMDDWLTFLKDHSELANSIILRLATRQ